MASRMFDLPIDIFEKVSILVTSSVGSYHSSKVEERPDHMVALERFKVLQLNRYQFQLLLAVFYIFHLMIPWLDWRYGISTITNRINLFHPKNDQSWGSDLQCGKNK